jgi:DNA-binding NtrC family response regulator
MPKKPSADKSLLALLDASNRPIYAIDANRRIVYCNQALEAWMELPAQRIVGRLVEYHSESGGDAESQRDPAGPLTGLCPPPEFLVGKAGHGTVSCLKQAGRLVHRRAEFLPIDDLTLHDDSQASRRPKARAGEGLLTFLVGNDLSPQELSADLSNEPAGDELHRVIRQFRRTQVGRYRVESLLGNSSMMQKLRAQVAFAAQSEANALICGRPGTGRAHVAHAIHYQSAGEQSAKLVALDAGTVTEDSCRQAIDTLTAAASGGVRPTLLVERIERLSVVLQAQLADIIGRRRLAIRLLATTDNLPNHAGHAAEADETPRHLDSSLRDITSTITINVPCMIDRMEDLPLLAQSFLEAENRGNAKQISSLTPETLDRLALYSWPGELDELREVIAAAHGAAATSVIRPADLPAVIHHAAYAAATPRRPQERIVLDDLLAAIEREAIVRALAQAGGNKSEAAELLGMTRPRLYRRLQQLGMIQDEPVFKERRDEEPQLPDFREVDPQESPS